MILALDYFTKYTSPNQSSGFEAETITVHWWGVPSSHRSGKIGGVVGWLCDPLARASAHFVTSGVTRQMACLIDLNRRAWHSANSVGNRTSVGIEMHPWDATTPQWQIEADLDAAAYNVALIWHWRPKTRGKALKGHLDWHNTACPGSYYPLLSEIKRRAELLYPYIVPGKPGYLEDGAPWPTATRSSTPEGIFGMSKYKQWTGRTEMVGSDRWQAIHLNSDRDLTMFIGPGLVQASANVWADLPEGATLQVEIYEVDFKSGERTRIVGSPKPLLELMSNGGNSWGTAVLFKRLAEPGKAGYSRRLRTRVRVYGLPKGEKIKVTANLRVVSE